MAGGSLSVHTFVLGLASWAIPFVGSCLFFDSTGKLAIPQPLFKSLMVVLFGGFGSWLLTVAFRRFPATPRSGLTLGLLWLVENVVLDVLILLPLSGHSFTDYVQDIGLRYLLMPLLAAAMGSAVATAGSTAKTAETSSKAE
jgi:hypothetical protein